MYIGRGGRAGESDGRTMEGERPIVYIHLCVYARVKSIPGWRHPPCPSLEGARNPGKPASVPRLPDRATVLLHRCFPTIGAAEPFFPCARAEGVRSLTALLLKVLFSSPELDPMPRWWNW